MPFSFTAAVQDALARLKSYYNGNPYNAQSNPGGYDNDGHRINFVPTLRDIANSILAIGGAADSAASSADAASGSASAAAGSAGAAAGSASAADTSAKNAAMYDSTTRVLRAGDTMTGPLNLAAHVTIAAASALAIGAAASDIILVSGGSTTINGFDTIASGAVRRVRFLGNNNTIKYNATSLILPGAKDIITQANDCAEFISFGGGNWFCTQYQRADGSSIAATGVSTAKTITNNYAITAADKGTNIIIGGTNSPYISAPSAATLGAGFYFYVTKQDGTPYGRFTPATGQLVDGLSFISIYQEEFMLWTDGTAWYSAGRQRGWVSIGRVSATGRYFNFPVLEGFSDPELREIEVNFDRVVIEANEAPTIRLVKPNSVIASPSYTYERTATSGSSAPTSVSATGSTAAAGIALTGVATTVLFGTMRAMNRLSTVGQVNRVLWDFQQVGATGRGMIYDTSQATTLGGVCISTATNGITSVDYTLKGYRQ